MDYGVLNVYCTWTMVYYVCTVRGTMVYSMCTYVGLWCTLCVLYVDYGVLYVYCTCTMCVLYTILFQVYGETSFDLVMQMIKSVEFKEEDTFVDLGSGMYDIPFQTEL